MIADSSTLMMDSESTPSPGSYANHSTTWMPSDGMVPVCTNPSRKRSRDETAFEAAEAENSHLSFPSAADVNPPEPIPEEPIYGEGMVLINPSSGRAVTAESQTGTWYEEKVEQEALARAQELAQAREQAQAQLEARPKLGAGRKSMRLSQSSMRTMLDGPHGTGSNLNSAPASPPKSTPSTEIDEATIALGIGWTKMSSEDPDMQAAARGWAKYIDVHYASEIHGAEILLKNRGLDAYLVGCQEGFYLFTEDLLRGQLVSRTWDVCLNNLRTSPMQFEGSQVVQAQRTPGPDIEATSEKHNMNGFNNWAGVNGQSQQMTNHVGSQAGASGMDLD